jgi:hypothetical protein
MKARKTRVRLPAPPRVLAFSEHCWRCATPLRFHSVPGSVVPIRSHRRLEFQTDAASSRFRGSPAGCRRVPRCDEERIPRVRDTARVALQLRGCARKRMAIFEHADVPALEPSRNRICGVSYLFSSCRWLPAPLFGNVRTAATSLALSAHIHRSLSRGTPDNGDAGSRA